jgi:PAS domain S-box-containing protein
MVPTQEFAMNDINSEPRPAALASPALERVQHASNEILELLPIPTFICDLEGRIVQYNRRAAGMWGRTPQPGQTHEQFAAATKYFSPDGQRLPRSRMTDVLRTGRALRDEEVMIERPNGDLFVVLLNIDPLFDEHGHMFGVINCIQDITERKRAVEALRRSQQELSLQEQRWNATYEHAAIAIVETDAEGRFLRVNEAICNIVGATREELLADRLFERDYPQDREMDEAQYRRQIAGEIDFYSIEKRVVRGDGRIIWCSIRSSTVRDSDGNFLYAVRVLQDITERKEAEDLQKLLIDELNHRVKNTLATVQSLAAQTAIGAKSLDEFHKAFEGRLIAIGKAHDQLMRRHWKSAELRDIVSATTTAYLTRARDQLSLAGDYVTVNPRAALTLALVIHELTTNAVKYGALSVPGGRIEAKWRVVRPSGLPPSLKFEWIERGGPAVPAPERRGFGSRFIESSVASELKGKAVLSFDPGGIRCTMEFPLDSDLVTIGDRRKAG